MSIDVKERLRKRLFFQALRQGPAKISFALCCLSDARHSIVVVLGLAHARQQHDTTDWSCFRSPSPFSRLTARVDCL